tara:strand:+ start:193 stop:360 length:168 start_codon:yes stop_codon:yes gene_type:complete
MKPQGEGRIYTKDITYTDKGAPVKDNGIPRATDEKTSGIEAVINTKAPKHPFTNG